MENEKTKLQESCLAFAKVLLAAGADWKDSTSYSRDAKEKIPTSFSTNIGGNDITITCGHIYHRSEWVFHCFSLGFDTKTLPQGLMAEQAATMAVRLCKTKVDKLAEAFSTCG